MEKTRLAVIGGFLGSGKTTLLRELAGGAAKDTGVSAGLITNDQAAGLVDTILLRRTGNTVEEVSGSCFCCNFDGFKAAFESLRAAGAGLVIAEPVGSCTDLTATVIRPAMEKLDAAVLPLSVLADPAKLGMLLAGDSGGLHKSTLYIMKKQLEEADYILVNKIDTLTAGETRHLILKTRRTFPEAKVYTVSALKGTGVRKWFADMLVDERAGQRIISVDYDTYAEGEAALGWLNTAIVLQCRDGRDWKEFLSSYLLGLKENLDKLDAAVGHVKSLVLGGDGFFITGNVTGRGKDPAVQGEVACSAEARFILNARAEIAPEKLETICLNILEITCGSSVQYRIETLKSLRPGYPNPTFKYTAKQLGGF
jgi:Ni2+-binding GTPase involved in maturation of urease and hydrogenase